MKIKAKQLAPIGVMGTRIPSFDTIKYGELIQVVRPDGYHTGVKVHFFNKRGVFVGNYYEWMNYSQLRYPNTGRHRERVFLGRRFERPRQAIYEICCGLATWLIRITQKMSA
jgi:hypothetical protein